MNQYRIAIMLPRLSHYGGAEQFGYHLAEALAARGHRVDFICARREEAPPQGVNVLVPGRPRAPKFVKMLVFMRRAEKIRRQGGYDCSIGLGKTLRQDIMRVGGGPLKEFWRYSELSIQSGPQRWWKRFRRRFSPSNWLNLWIESRQFQKGIRIIAVSDFVKKLILDAYPALRSEDLTVIYNRPDLTRFVAPGREQRRVARESMDIRVDTVAIGFASSNFELKGTGPLIKALSGLPANYHLYIAGKRGHSAYSQLAKRLGLEKRVHFLGKVENMPEFYQALDIFALPTFYDACSNVVLEALATGLPVLSSRSNGSALFLPPENVIQNPGDSLELAKLLQKLGSNLEKNVISANKFAFHWPADVRAGVDEFVNEVESIVKDIRSGLKTA